MFRNKVNNRKFDFLIKRFTSSSPLFINIVKEKTIPKTKNFQFFFLIFLYNKISETILFEQSSLFLKSFELSSENICFFTIQSFFFKFFRRDFVKKKFFELVDSYNN